MPRTNEMVALVVDPLDRFFGAVGEVRGFDPDEGMCRIEIGGGVRSSSVYQGPGVLMYRHERAPDVRCLGQRLRSRGRLREQLLGLREMIVSGQRPALVRAFAHDEFIRLIDPEYLSRSRHAA